MTIRIPVYQPALLGREREYVLDCMDTGWISSKGKYVTAFERRFADYVGAPHGLSVCNGTASLHLALLALGAGAGDEVIVPTLTYVASVNAIRYTGATPVFVDSDAHSWQIDVNAVVRCITPRTRGILVVHLYGQPCDMEGVCAIAHRYGLFVVEDCAEAFGSRIGDRHVGCFGDIGTFSFYGNKTVTSGEGGMTVTRNPTLADRMRRLRGQGLADEREYWHDMVGYNYRMSNLCAAIGLAQLEQAEMLLQRKRAIAERYRRAFAGSGLSFHEQVPGTTHSYWMCSILTRTAEGRDPLRARLAAAGIETRPLFHPVHTMPMYAGPALGFPVAEDLGSRGINLPSWPGLSDEQIDEIVATALGVPAPIPPPRRLAAEVAQSAT
jgi:perosamine synthetase